MVVTCGLASKGSATTKGLNMKSYLDNYLYEDCICKDQEG